MARIEIYTTPTCPFCHMAKALLREKGADFKEIDVTSQPGMRAKMTQRANGRRTVPQIFVNDRLIGGNDDLQALERAGKLDALLAEGSDAQLNRAR
ncbi:glutaredoxin 3 [Paracoccus tegillarcae]|uniref:Glutaredoxin n=1 Tax=Paracoccus tegillarcae TaxID=1529068 RepID=A0A2K9EFE2_9RHOB|nr:glutaredoxin 3 [Paracoccus tegillarcae]AUH33653.1 glutaredoxin 3 [Paracoccus tegillarcae]